MRKLVLLLVTVLGAASLAEAMGNIKVGDVLVSPRANVEGRFDDNIFLTSATEESSGILDATVGSAFSLQGSRLKTLASYDFRLLRYQKFSTVNDAVGHDAMLDVTYDLANEGKVGVNNHFLDTTDPSTNEQTTRAKRYHNSARGFVESPVGADIYLGLYVQDEYHHYHGERNIGLANTYDRNEVYVGPRVGYKVSERLRTYLDYRYGQIDYRVDVSTSKNNVTHSAMVGAEGEFTARLTGNVAVGVQSRDYETELPGVKNKETTPSLEGGVRWSAPADVIVDVGASRHFEESAFNRYYRASELHFSVGKSFMQRIQAEVNGRAGIDNYPDDMAKLDGTLDKRDDTLFQGGLKVTYKFPEILETYVSYLFRARESNFDQFDYANNLVSVGVGARF